jgi:hypothetical protein
MTVKKLPLTAISDKSRPGIPMWKRKLLHHPRQGEKVSLMSWEASFLSRGKGAADTAPPHPNGRKELRMSSGVRLPLFPMFLKGVPQFRSENFSVVEQGLSSLCSQNPANLLSFTHSFPASLRPLSYYSPRYA